MLPNEVISLFETALEQPDWIEDKVADQFPRARGKNDSVVPPPASGSGANNGNPSQGKKRGPSKSLAVDSEQVPAKRRRGDHLRN